MKAFELAALLLQNPDLDVYVETYSIPNFDDGFYNTESVDGIQQITPSGIFLNLSSIEFETEYQLKSPSRFPKIGSGFIVLNEPNTLFLFGEPYDIDDVFQNIVDYGYFSSYIGWHHGTWILKKNEAINTDIEYSDSTTYLISDISKISVLDSVDENWNEIYVDYTYSEYIDKFRYQNGEVHNG